MLGQAIKFSPNIHEYNPNVITEDFYFPQGYWCNIFDYSCIHQVADGVQKLDINPSHLNLHLREGWIIPHQDSINFDDQSVHELTDDATNWIVNLDKKLEAKGFIHFDDGEQIPFTDDQ
jgi:alpha-glucosidase (family GH31 glycosyl hydrolase)